MSDVDNITINGKSYLVNPDVGDLLLNLSLEKDGYKRTLKAIKVLLEDIEILEEKR